MLKKFALYCLLLTVCYCYAINLYSGTLIYDDRSVKSRDPQKRQRILTKVKLVSICKGKVVIEKDGGKRTIPLRRLREYYDKDIKGGDTADFDDNTANYTVQITSKPVVPRTGYKKDKKNHRRRISSSIKFAYTIIKQDKVHKTDRIRQPYFYLYIYISGADEYHNSNIRCFYSPKAAKIKCDGYNRAEIISAVKSFKRTIIHLNDEYTRRYMINTHRKIGAIGGEYQVEFTLKGIKSRRILAYHLEVWGKDDIVASDHWEETGIGLDKNWWIR